MTLVMFQVIVRQENLGHRQSVRAEEFFVNRHEPRLAHGRTSLQLRQIVRTFLVPERAHAGSHRAGGHQDDLFARLALCHNLRHQLLHLGEVRLLPAIGQHTGSQLDYDAGDIFE